MSGLAHFLTLTLASLVALFPGAAASPASPSVVSSRTPAVILHATVLFGGDMMFDRTIRSTIDKKGGDFIFSCIDPLLQKADLVVANLEGPITDNPSKSMGTPPGSDDNFTFTFPTTTAPLLFAHHVGLVNLGNNHVTNFGYDGVASTTQALAKAGVGYFGDPPAYSVAHLSGHEVRFAFINYNEFDPDSREASTIIRQIRDARAAGGIPVVYTHWGIEYATTSSAHSRELAHMFIDAGAEIVVGSHPHVVEEREFYRGKYIYYSLGNLIFDQYWNEDVRRGLMISVDFDSRGVQYVEEIPVHLERDRRTCPIDK